MSSTTMNTTQLESSENLESNASTDEKDQDPKHKKSISITSALVTAAAAITAATASTYLGTAGTIIGAGVVAALTTIGIASYEAVWNHATTRLFSKRPKTLREAVSYLNYRYFALLMLIVSAVITGLFFMGSKVYGAIPSADASTNAPVVIVKTPLPAPVQTPAPTVIVERTETIREVPTPAPTVTVTPAPVTVTVPEQPVPVPTSSPSVSASQEPTVSTPAQTPSTPAPSSSPGASSSSGSSASETTSPSASGE